MKKLADYKDDAAIELWADLLEPMSSILSDKNILSALESGKPIISIAAEILKKHAAEAKNIMLRIDNTPLNGLNIIFRLKDVITEIKDGDTAADFFDSAAAKTE